MAFEEATDRIASIIESEGAFRFGTRSGFLLCH